MKDQLNAYTCRKCGGQITTIDRDEGTTFFGIGCKATIECDGVMYSSFYRVDQTMKPSWEWYKPEPREMYGKSAGLRHHVQLGGLLLREIKEETK